MAYRGAMAAAERLGTSAVTFPSDHGGFLGGEYGQAGDPDAFADGQRLEDSTHARSVVGGEAGRAADDGPQPVSRVTAPPRGWLGRARRG